MLKKICLGLAIVGLLQFTSADAAVVVVSEGIYETGIIGRDFTRIRTKDGVDTIETNDATIIAQNNIDNDFGVYNGDNVTYTHQLGWAGLSGGSFTSAALEIAAFGVTGSDDDVFIGVNLDQFVGTLTNGEWYTAFFSISTFDLTVHLALLNDFTLEVLIDKNGFLGGPSTIFTSTLTATYETGNVPEPASIAVWSALAAIGGVVTWRKRKMLHAA